MIQEYSKALELLDNLIYLESACFYQFFAEGINDIQVDRWLGLKLVFQRIYQSFKSNKIFEVIRNLTKCNVKVWFQTFKEVFPFFEDIFILSFVDFRQLKLFFLDDSVSHHSQYVGVNSTSIWFVQLFSS